MKYRIIRKRGGLHVIQKQYFGFLWLDEMLTETTYSLEYAKEILKRVKQDAEWKRQQRMLPRITVVYEDQ